jgi:hypothetical protein
MEPKNVYFLAGDELSVPELNLSIRDNVHSKLGFFRHKCGYEFLGCGKSSL